MILDIDLNTIRFAVEKIGSHYHVVAMDEHGKLLNLVEGAESASMQECKRMHASIKECAQCRRQAVGFTGANHFGSRNCRCGSLASGGHRSHCSCSACY